MSNETEKDTSPSEKIEVVHASEVLFTEQQAIIQSLKQELELSKKMLTNSSTLCTGLRLILIIIKNGLQRASNNSTYRF